MKKSILTAMMVAFGLGLVGCGDTANDQGKEQAKEVKKEIKTFEYYIENQAEMTKKIEECGNSTSTNSAEIAECENAKEAKSRLNAVGVSKK